MFIHHYDKKFINCTNEQLDQLVYTSKTLFKIYGKGIYEHEVLDALYLSDDIFYSAKYLFTSKKSLDELYPNYCCLARLIFKFYTKQIYQTELDAVVSNMSAGRIPLDQVYTEFY